MIWIVWSLFIIEEVLRNYYVIEKKKKYINHGLEAIIRLVVSIAIIIIANPATWLHVICWFIGAFFSFWLFFNIGLNALRRKPFGYVGKSAWLDKIEGISPSVSFNVFAKAAISAGFIYGYYNTHLF